MAELIVFPIATFPSILAGVTMSVTLKSGCCNISLFATGH